MSTNSHFILSSILLRLRPILGTGLLACAGLSMLGGCHSLSDSQVALMERELRQKEDYIYELEDYVVDYSEKLRSCRCSNQQPHQSRSGQSSIVKSAADAPEPELAIDKPRKKKRTLKTPQLDEPQTPTPESFDAPGLEILPEEMEIPELEIEEPSASAWRDPNAVQPVAAEEELPANVEPNRDGLIFIPDPVDYDSPEEDTFVESELPSEEAFSEASAEELITFDDELAIDEEFYEEIDEEPAELDRIAITKVFRNLESGSEHGSLLTVVEMLDTHGRPMDVPGEISLMIRTRSGDKPTKLERWDFNDEETAVSWQSSPLGEGLHLELPLEQQPLPDKPLELLARLVLADGSKLLARLPIEPAQIVALEVETGAEQLVAEVNPEDEIDSTRLLPESQSVLVVTQLPKQQTLATASEPKSKTTDDSQPRWRSSMQHAGRPTASYASTAKPTANQWTSQPLGGRAPVRPTTVATRPLPQPPQPSTSNTPKQPLWISSRPNRKTPTTQPTTEPSPGWSAWR